MSIEMQTHRKSRFVFLNLWLVALCWQQAHGAVLDVVNRLRAGECAAHSNLSPLVHDKRLDSAAQRIARGTNAKQALQDMRYPILQVATIHLAGFTRETELLGVLHDRYCSLLLQAEWQRMGSVWRRDDLWIVLAVPHVVPTDRQAVAREVLALVNQARSSKRRCGRQEFAAGAPLKLNTLLTEAAQRHAEDMAKHRHMEHAGSDGSTPAQRITRQGYRWQVVGENVAAGAGTANEVVSGWLDSPGHCANIMNPSFTEMGLGFAINRDDEYAVYWAQSFGRPRP